MRVRNRSLHVIAKGVALLLWCSFSISIKAQPLFTYGSHAVGGQEFLKAFSKNNANVKPGEKSLREYLELYIRFKLKVQSALDLRLDTLAAQREEWSNFRSQVIENYLNDEESLNRLVDEAMVRSRKDIRLAHILIALPPSPTADEVAKGREKARALYNRLREGADFFQQALDYSDDPAVKTNRGDIGYITALVLPYELENIIYATAPGSFSEPYQSSVGFHIFKNLLERPAAGQVRVSQVLLAFPPEATTEQRSQVKHLADSLYQALKQGADFSDIALRYSADNFSYRNGGELAEFGVGQYEPAFEAAAFALPEDGAIGAPVETEYGYHILRRLKHTPVAADQDDPVHREAFRQLVTGDERIAVSRNIMMQKILSRTGYKKLTFDTTAFRVITDSVLAGQQIPVFPKLKSNTPLFSFKSKSVTLRDWIQYLETFRGVEGFSNGKSAAQLLEQFAGLAATDYYKEHLEEFQPEFAAQMKEFKEGNLLFEIMQRKIWDVASADSAGLRKYYEAHHLNYWWEPSADVVLLTASSEALAKSAAAALHADPYSWRSLVENSQGNLQADSGRYELAQLPMEQSAQAMEGMISAPLKNEPDGQYLFCLIRKLYPQRTLRSFNDARGFVINDYQGLLEEQWIAALKRRYPVKVNEAVFKSLLK